MLPMLLATALVSLPTFALAQNVQSNASPVATATQAPDKSARLAVLADRISYDSSKNILTLEGNVTIFTEGRILRADLIIYDDVNETLEVPGAFTFQEAGGPTLSGQGAGFDAQLETGLLRGFRALIREDLAIAAVAAQRVDGRYIALSRAVASTCDVCTEEDIPAWQFRAQRIVYDERDAIVHYENAIFDLFGVPIFYFPYLRHPGPGTERATGFLAPRPTQSSRYGLSVKLPYYIAISPSADATITPFVTQNEGTVLETEYRQLWDRSSLELYSSLLPNSNTPEFDERWHFIGAADTDVARDTTARANIELVSDDGYLNEFGYARPDRLPSSIGVDQFRTDGFWSVSARTYISLREGEKQSTVPVVLPDVEYLEIVDRGNRSGGSLRIRASAVQLSRTEGRDAARISVGTGLERSGSLPFGLFLRGFADLDGDIFQTRDDPAFPSETVYRLRPIGGIEASVPFFRTEDGVSETIEPVVQFVFAGDETKSGDIPNEDSQQVDFDETNLFAKSRFPGDDRYESGNRVDVGLRYQRVTQTGWASSATIGQVFREEPVEEFAPGTGLDGRRSSTVTAVSVGYLNQVGLDARSLIDTNGEITRSEVLGRYTDGRFRLNGSYVFLRDEGETGLPEDRTEIAFNTAVPLTEHWTGEGSLRRDLETDRFIQTRLGAVWRSDCAAVSLSGTRDFTRSVNVVPTTQYAITFRFNGIGDTGEAVRRSCAQF
jgi:LPS-assembly protein